MPRKLIMTTATLAMLAAVPGCCSMESADCCPAYTGCCRELSSPALAEPYLSEPVAAPYAEAAATVPAQAPSEPVVRWPGNAAGLVYDWSNGNGGNLERRGKAKIDRNGVMQLARGSYVPQGFDARLLEACSRTDELSIEATLMTDRKNQKGPARIVSFSRDVNSRNFTLGQEGEHLVLRLRTERNDKNGTNPQVSLGKVITGEPMHVVVSYRSGDLRFFVNGELVKKSSELKGSFHNWEPMALVLGDELDGNRDWHGSIERLAIRSRFLGDDEAARQFELTRQSLKSTQ